LEADFMRLIISALIWLSDFFGQAIIELESLGEAV
jgi:hypothetical protein